MMKFSRPYERSVLVYREEDGGRILLRLGRTYEDGECRPDRATDIPEGFKLLTYILSKDSEALIRDVSERFSEYADPELQVFEGIVFDALKLQARIQQELASGSTTGLLQNLDMIYGNQVVETLLAATFGKDARAGKKAAMQAQTATAKRDLPGWSIAVTAFSVIIVLPLAITFFVNPSAINLLNPEQEEASPGAIVTYGLRNAPELASAQDPLPPAVQRESRAAQLLEEARALKQAYYVRLGEMSEDQEFIRAIPVTDRLPDQPALLEEAPPTLASAQPSGDIEAWQRDRARSHFIPATVSGFALDKFGTFDNGGAPGATAIFDLAYGPATIFDVTSDPLIGFTDALDKAVAGLCVNLMMPDEEGMEMSLANLYFEIGNSEFAATVIDQQVCMAGSYAIFPLFDMVTEEAAQD